MYKIRYFILEVVDIIENEDDTVEIVTELREHYYECKDAELEQWYNYIKETYGEYGEVTYEWFEYEPTKEELEKEELEAEIKALKEQLLEVQNYVIDKEYNNLLENGGMKDVI
ncbi:MULTISPECIES: hypothetical protein [unclassified Clostridium]|uniref:hypothetical protein n=1 Tax=unclassified Clostridium TaxID=2614128 RepID=UPI0025B8CC8F|nr:MULTISPECIES: hypothetical protein [unclassified Clostridium]